MVIKRNKTIAYMFYVWFIATVFSYAFFAVSALSHGTFVYWEYSKINVAFPLNYTTHLKDALMLLLFAVLIWKHRIRHSFICVVPIAMWCLFITVIQNGKESVLMTIAGIREFLPFAVCLMLREEEKRSESPLLNKKTLIRVLQWCIVIEAVFLLAQIARHGMWMIIGKAGNRLPGTMGNGGSLGYLGIGTSVYAYCLYSMKQIKRAKASVLLVLSLFISVASGARNAIFITLIAIVFFFGELFFSTFDLSRRRLYLILIPLLAAVGIPLVRVLSAYIGRGTLSVSGGGRIELFKQLFNRPVLQLLFGKGLGDRTNAAVSLGAKTTISDGTITAMIAQFGIIGFVIIAVVFCYFAIKWFKKRRLSRNVMVLLVLSILVSVLSINIFEQPILIMMYFLAFRLVTSKNSLIR